MSRSPSPPLCRYDARWLRADDKHCAALLVSLELPVTNLDNPVAIGAAMDGAFMTILRNHEPAVKRAFS
jgi:hypothetical protein